MKRRGALLLALALVPGWSAAALPARELCVELREASGEAGAAGGWQVGTAGARAARERPPQRLCVQNGERATMSAGLTRPVQVWQAAPGLVLPVPVPTTQWIPAGQRLALRARWPGGREPVQLEIEAEASRFDPSVAAGSGTAPSRTDAGLQTSLRVPLDGWVTIASAGPGTPEAGAVSTLEARPGLVLQVRVSLGR